MKIKDTLFFGIAVLAAILVSLFLREPATINFLSIIVVICAIALTAIVSLRSRRSSWQIAVITLLPAALFAALACSNLPLRLAFQMYRGTFDKVALQIENGSPPETPFWIGPFRIGMVGRRESSGIIYVATNRDNHEIEGFVRHPNGRGFNLWSCVQLDETWSYIAED